MRVLLTGGAGFIGSHLCDQLLLEGYKVVCLDNLRIGNLKNIAHLRDDASFEYFIMNAGEGCSRASFEEKVRINAYYVRGWSVWLDLVLLVRTVDTVLFSRGAV